MKATCVKASTEQVARYADMFSAMGTEPRLRIMQLLLSAHPEGLVVGDIQQELEIPNAFTGPPMPASFCASRVSMLTPSRRKWTASS